MGIKLFTAHPVGHHIDIDPVVLAFSPLIIPCFDVVRVYMLRLRQHRNPFLPDKSHIHHKLLAAGMKPRGAMVSIVSASVLFTLLNVWLSTFLNINVIVVLDVALWVVANIRLSSVIRKHKAVA